MRQISYYVVLLALLVACQGNEKPVEQPKQETTLAPSLKASEIFQKSLEAYNTDAFYNSTITFNMGDMYYDLQRQNNISNFEVTRVAQDTTYKATYKNGYVEYFVNDILKDDTGDFRRFAGARLEGLAYLFSIPHVFKQTGVYLKRLEDATIRKKAYYAIHISFTKIEDAPENEFILYINPDTYFVDYFTDKYDLVPGDRLTFKVAHNRRTIEGFPFADYFVLTPRMQKKATDPVPDTKLEDVYKSYNERDLDELNSLLFENIKVELN